MSFVLVMGLSFEVNWFLLCQLTLIVPILALIKTSLFFPGIFHTDGTTSLFLFDGHHSGDI